ncbi:anhydro-N-acetylmuramic acid kinase [Myxosarcina sp. GI1]|uniref:anhydro-N-acetylmuramic acid kinase n=1 Tax=Myxosarcina sp. GI1 TaxID=1541065 RepID=UPI00055F6591|nr:anhydro-N-acetylmuramic acid kinase [Myxosarcina sp. GI1]
MKVIGAISGTSVDGIDVALVEISGGESELQIELLAGNTYPYPQNLRRKILAVCGGKSLTVAELATLDDAIAFNFALAARSIQAECQETAELIGSHGQTVYHRPPIANGETNIGYSLQLGRGAVIASQTDLTTISNFRAADLAAGGEGAPLVSKIDACLLAHPTQHTAVQNIGGIGNLTYLPPKNKSNWQQRICGWDTGPGNALIDLAVEQLTNGSQTYDKDGSWAAQGSPCFKLVEQWIKQDFFKRSPPKSTGRELFSRDYLSQCWQDAKDENLSSADWLATIAELTVASIVHSYHHFLPQLPERVLLCGGGSRNLYLKQRLRSRLTATEILTTDDVGLNADYKEAIAFAVLAYWRLNSIPGNLPQVTGAKKPMLLGDIHYPLNSSNVLSN